MAKDKRKLTIVSVSGIHNFIGGAETFNRELCNGLNKRGHRVIQLFATLNKQETIGLVSANKYFYELGKFNLFDINIKGVFTLFLALRKIVKSAKPDILYLHLYLPPLSLALFSRFFKIPKVIHTYGVWHKEFESSNFQNKTAPSVWIRFKYQLGLFMRKFLQKFMLSKADGIIVLSDFHKEQMVKLVGLKPEKIKIIAGGVNHDIFFPSKKQKRQIKNQIGFSNKKIITLVSRIEPRKGILEAIQAMSIVVQHTDAMLLIISPHYDCTFLHYLSDCYRAVNKYNLGGKVLFKTGLTKEQLRPYYQLSDCFFMSSIILETFGLTMIEALKSGTVVIGARSGNTTKILEKIDPKLLAARPTPKLFAKKILDFLDLPYTEKQTLSKRGLKLAKNFDWQIESLKLEKYLYKLKSNFDWSTLDY